MKDNKTEYNFDGYEPGEDDAQDIKYYDADKSNINIIEFASKRFKNNEDGLIEDLLDYIIEGCYYSINNDYFEKSMRLASIVNYSNRRRGIVISTLDRLEKYNYIKKVVDHTSVTNVKIALSNRNKPASEAKPLKFHYEITPTLHNKLKVYKDKL